MDRTKREIVATLIKAGRKDLARHFVQAAPAVKIPMTNNAWKLYDFSDAGKQMAQITRSALKDVERDVALAATLKPDVLKLYYRKRFDEAFEQFEKWRGIGATDTAVRDVLWGVFQKHAKANYKVDLGMG